jgi:hypothetical protein
MGFGFCCFEFWFGVETADYMFRVLRLGFGVYGYGFKVSGLSLGFSVSGLEYGI